MFGKKLHGYPKKRTSYIPWVGLLFIIFGGLFLGKLAKYHFRIWQIGSEMIYQLSFVEWVVAIGCFFGGIYMLYVSIFFRRIFI